MATKITFDFEPWNNKADVPLDRPGTSIGYAVVNGNLPVGVATTRRQAERDTTIGPAVRGVIELLAGSLEWLREYGFTAADVQSKVQAYMIANRGSRSQTVLKAARAGIEDVSDPRNLLPRMDKHKVIPVQ